MPLLTPPVTRQENGGFQLFNAISLSLSAAVAVNLSGFSSSAASTNDSHWPIATHFLSDPSFSAARCQDRLFEIMFWCSPVALLHSLLPALQVQCYHGGNTSRVCRLTMITRWLRPARTGRAASKELEEQVRNWLHPPKLCDIISHSSNSCLLVGGTQ